MTPAAKTDTPPVPRFSGGASRRSLARLGAIQALYQMALSEVARETVLQEFLDHRLSEETEELQLADMDREFFAALMQGIDGEAAQLDDMLSAVLAEGWPVERLETLLKLILRAGAYELAFRPDIPARAVIKEYVDLAHAFLSGKEPGMVNGVLDRMAHQLRPEEFAATTPSEPRGG